MASQPTRRTGSSATTDTASGSKRGVPSIYYAHRFVMGCLLGRTRAHVEGEAICAGASQANAK
jgi:hypothetical protein